MNDKMEDKKSNNKIVYLLLISSILIISMFAFILLWQSSVISTRDARITYLENYYESEEKKSISEGQYNFQVMRDLFTPMYDDSVTVENAGYNKGWLFWVNHTQVLNSYYFSNMNSYLVIIPEMGKIELMNS